MFPASLPDDIRSMSIPDRIELASAIWDSVAEDGDSIALTDPQREEIDRRLALRESNPRAGESWESVKRRLQSEL